MAVALAVIRRVTIFSWLPLVDSGSINPATSSERGKALPTPESAGLGSSDALVPNEEAGRDKTLCLWFQLWKCCVMAATPEKRLYSITNSDDLRKLWVFAVRNSLLESITSTSTTGGREILRACSSRLL